MIWQAKILRERNELDSARSLAVEAVALCEQAVSLPHCLIYLRDMLCWYVCTYRAEN